MFFNMIFYTADTNTLSNNNENLDCLVIERIPVN